MKIEFKDEDEDCLNFDIENYQFVVSWVEKIKTYGLGRQFDSKYPEFQLSAWHSTHGGYWHPPETYDVPVGKPTEYPSEIAMLAVCDIIKQKINIALENESYRQQAEEFKKFEENVWQICGNLLT